MSSNILIAPNSFKECADSVTIAELISNNLSELEEFKLITRPISDGGDGFLKVCQYYFGGEVRRYLISTCYSESRFKCPVLYCESKQTMYIESAEVLGLKVVPNYYRDPMKLSSRGLGELLLKINEDIRRAKIKVKKVFIGIGGTATIDLGMGMMSVLGLNLLSSNGDKIAVIPGNFQFLQRLVYKPIKLLFRLYPVVDVKNSLFGKLGGIKVFGKQKGANMHTISVLEKNFNHLINLFENNGLKVFSNKLSGAGGGIAAALQIFFNSRLINSDKFILNTLNLKEFTGKVDYLITGEGAFDEQSFTGKGAGILINAVAFGVKKIFLVCGRINLKKMNVLPNCVVPIELNKYFKNKDVSVLNYMEGIKKACVEIISVLGV